MGTRALVPWKRFVRWTGVKLDATWGEEVTTDTTIFEPLKIKADRLRETRKTRVPFIFVIFDHLSAISGMQLETKREPVLSTCKNSFCFS